MILGIDTATSQRWLNFAMPIAEGYDHIYVKMGGDNVDPTYEAPFYDEQIDKARFMGYKKIGHYWVPNGDPSDADDIDTPEQQSDFMIDNLRNWNPATDFIVEDNESLDGATRYNDAQLAAAIERKKSRLGIPGRQVLTYLGLHDARSNEWPLTLATGTNFIIAAYSYPPFGWPAFSSIPADRIVGHQTGGRVFAAVPGAPESATRNGVPTDINSFKDNAFDFGGAPVSLEDQMRQYAAANQKPATGQASWDQMCGSLMYRFNTWRGWTRQPSGDISSAYKAGSASMPLNLDASAAPIGAWHFFDIGGVLNGHVVQDAQGGGWRCFSTGYTLGESLGKAIGFVSVNAYATAKGARYRGWATNYAGGTISVAATAGGGYTPIEEEDMPLTPEEIHAVATYLLNYPAYDGAPSLSQVLKEIHSDSSNVFHATFTGGPSMQDGGKPISQSLAEINGKPVSTGGGDVINLSVSDSDVEKIAKATRSEFKENPLA